MASKVETRLQGCAFSPLEFRSRVFDTDERLRRLERLVLEHFTESIPLGRAAAEACLARCYFSTYFRRQTGMGFHAWLTSIRIYRATRVLLATGQSISEIAWSVGFQDMTTFARAFRRVTGTTPTRYRRANPRLLRPAPRLSRAEPRVPRAASSSSRPSSTQAQAGRRRSSQRPSSSSGRQRDRAQARRSNHLG